MIGFQQQKKKEEEKEKATKSVTSLKGGNKKVKKITAAELRVQKDLPDIDKRWSDAMKYPDPNNILKFTLTVVPDDGIWKGHPHDFTFDITTDYPMKAPKVLCVTKIYHPNIDKDGKICLNILREDWKPVLTLNAIFTGLHFLFLEPNTDDPLDLDAAKVYDNDKSKFIKTAKNYMKGQYY
eukprot:gene10315-2731_t